MAPSPPPDGSLRPEMLLQAAVDRLYATFSAAPAATVAICLHCTSAADVASLAVPVHEITPAALGRYLPKALTTWGGIDDLRRVVPRVLELTASRQLELDPAVVFAKLDAARWKSWEQRETAAILDLLSALWLSAIAQPLDGGPAWRVLVAIAEATDDLATPLDDWLLVLASSAPERVSGRAHLDELRAAVDRRDGDVSRLFWSPRPVASDQLRRWLQQTSD